jgi:hypothetical protein
MYGQGDCGGVARRRGMRIFERAERNNRDDHQQLELDGINDLENTRHLDNVGCNHYYLAVDNRSGYDQRPRGSGGGTGANLVRARRTARACVPIVDERG